MTYFKCFADNLRQMMINKGLKQKDVADACGITVSTVNNILNYRTASSLMVAVSICQYFDVSLDWMLGLRSKTGERYY